MKLVIEYDFSDDSDFEFYRMRLVDMANQLKDEMTDPLNDGEYLNDRGRCDGTVEVSWDTED